MKKKTKIFIVMLLLLCLTILCGCNSSGEKLSIDNHTWEFNIVQNSKGEIIYCNSENQDLYENAEVLDLWNSIKDGIMLISNNATQETFSFDYDISQKNSKSYIYDVTYTKNGEITEGTAVVGITTKLNENDECTLILSIDDYSIYFSENIE